MKTIKATFLIAMLALLGGCMVVPVSPGYYEPAYVGPSVGIGIYGGGWGHGGGRGGGHGRGWGHR
ncbi:MAG: hypothetical protein IH604_12875 [Burkholderiales bacterium]|nr:hypothetical protein [Burkholderiales bacterium]